MAQTYIWWNLIANIRPDSGQIFLHYNIIFGVDLVGEWYKIFFLPIIGLGITLANYLLSIHFYSSDKFLARILGIWCLLIQVLLVVGTSLLIRLNV
ncbi:MAG: hypothetical protein AAB348_02710 [Patescibacteria group bacterium]